MDWFKYINMFYKQKLWTIEQVRAGVQMGKITTEQYEEITGEPYQE